MRLKLVFHTESADHGGYCSGNEGEYDEDYDVVIIPIPESLTRFNEYDIGYSIPLSEFANYDFKEVIEHFGYKNMSLIDLLHEFDKEYYGFIKFRMCAGQSGYCDRDNLPNVFSDRRACVRMCNTDYVQLVRAKIIH